VRGRAVEHPEAPLSASVASLRDSDRPHVLVREALVSRSWPAALQTRVEESGAQAVDCRQFLWHLCGRASQDRVARSWSAASRPVPRRAGHAVAAIPGECRTLRGDQPCVYWWLVVTRLCPTPLSHPYGRGTARTQTTWSAGGEFHCL